ncbi:Protein tramtrack, alpha isoform [Portunus trituberculatus]|uniref:Protein tramtrack, alpha isoform n=1 Tax=Portunus trituberculatus TaxID=210409 RepID=A0A5B7DGB7_PORTR|nr:Protein tramtrack, alpha isoform [Portunus trituberculatus]
MSPVCHSVVLCGGWFSKDRLRIASCSFQDFFSVLLQCSTRLISSPEIFPCVDSIVSSNEILGDAAVYSKTYVTASENLQLLMTFITKSGKLGPACLVPADTCCTHTTFAHLQQLGSKERIRGNMSIREGKAGRRSDSVWSHFTKRWTDEKHYVVICIHCKQRVSAKVDRLRRHLRKCISCYIIPKPDIEGMEDCLLAGSSDPQPIASECPSVDASSSGLSPPWKVENVLIDSKDSPHSPSAMANQQYCLKWNNHQSNLLRAFDRLLQSESFTDVTLACEGKSLRAHKVYLWIILCTKKLFARNDPFSEQTSTR